VGKKTNPEAKLGARTEPDAVRYVRESAGNTQVHLGSGLLNDLAKEKNSQKTAAKGEAGGGASPRQEGVQLGGRLRIFSPNLKGSTQEKHDKEGQWENLKNVWKNPTRLKGKVSKGLDLDKVGKGTFL